MNSLTENLAAYNINHFFDLSPDLFCIAGYDGYFKKVNPAVSKLLGYSNQELLSRPISDFVYHDNRSMMINGNKNHPNSFSFLNYENRYIKKNGEIVWLSWTSMPVETEDSIYAIAKNITQKKKIEDDRDCFIKDLTRINNDLKQLSYTTSHDLRSPVNNLLMIFKMLNISKIHDTETLEFINVLKEATVSLKDTLNTYVDAFNAQDGITVNMGEQDLNECLNTVLHSLNVLIKNSRAPIKADFTGISKVKFNKAFLESIFLNLITNSIKYARPNVAPVINIRSAIVKGAKQLTFTDNGLGFNMDKVKDKIFGFNQKFHHHADSKGVGLYLVYNHIKSLGGNIVVESKINEGATFLISFKN